jgi:hypothetical protein
MSSSVSRANASLWPAARQPCAGHLPTPVFASHSSATTAPTGCAIGPEPWPCRRDSTAAPLTAAAQQIRTDRQSTSTLIASDRTRAWSAPDRCPAQGAAEANRDPQPLTAPTPPRLHGAATAPRQRSARRCLCLCAVRPLSFPRSDKAVRITPKRTTIVSQSREPVDNAPSSDPPRTATARAATAPGRTASRAGQPPGRAVPGRSG